ncbi:hypothetical protein XPA_006498 [Xanthoria parietina]
MVGLCVHALMDDFRFGSLVYDINLTLSSPLTSPSPWHSSFLPWWTGARRFLSFRSLHQDFCFFWDIAYDLKHIGLEAGRYNAGYGSWPRTLLRRFTTVESRVGEDAR